MAGLTVPIHETLSGGRADCLDGAVWPQVEPLPGGDGSSDMTADLPKGRRRFLTDEERIREGAASRDVLRPGQVKSGWDQRQE